MGIIEGVIVLIGGTLCAWLSLRWSRVEVRR